MASGITPPTLIREVQGAAVSIPAQNAAGNRLGDNAVVTDFVGTSSSGVYEIKKIANPSGGNENAYPNGVQVYPGGAGSVVQTVGAVTATLFSYTFQATQPGVYVFVGVISADQSNRAAGAWAYAQWAVRWDGTTATLVGTLQGTGLIADSALSAATVALSITGNTVNVRVTGVTALTINWGSNIAFVPNLQ